MSGPERQPVPGARPAGHTRRAAAISLVIFGGLLLALVGYETPWQTLPRPAGGAVGVDAARDFTAAEMAREDAFHELLSASAFVSLGVTVLLAAVLGFTSAGARLVTAVARPFGGGPVARLVLGAVAVTAAAAVVTLPLSIWREDLRRQYGLSSRQWSAYALDEAKGFGVLVATTLVGVVVLYLVARRFPRTWWAPAAALGAVLVVGAAFLYPVVVEPVFNDFRSLPDGPTRTSLLDLAERSGVDVDDVLVADASRRTTALNAYVSGFGRTRRIVVYDNTLVTLPPDQLETIVAHELGHAANDDVVFATAAGVLGVSAGTSLLYLLVSWPALLRRAGVNGIADPRSVALVLSLVTLAGVLTQPAQLLVSRRVEARADVYSLNLTRDPATLIGMQRRLAVINIGELDPPPLVYGMFASHPVAPERIAIARTWARLHGVPVPPDTVGTDAVTSPRAAPPTRR